MKHSGGIKRKISKKKEKKKHKEVDPTQGQRGLLTASGNF